MAHSSAAASLGMAQNRSRTSVGGVEALNDWRQRRLRYLHLCLFSSHGVGSRRDAGRCAVGIDGMAISPTFWLTRNAIGVAGAAERGGRAAVASG